MDNMDFYSKALAYHTKGRKAILEQTDLEETKCSCCDADPCNCDDDCSCKDSVKEASVVNGKNMDGEKRWKTTGLSHDDAIAKHGKENVKVTKGGLRNGDDHVQVYTEGADEVNDKNIDAIHDKEENEPVDNIVKKTEAMIAGKQPHDTPIESIYKDYSNTSVEKQASEEPAAVEEDLNAKADTMRAKERANNRDAEAQADANKRAEKYKAKYSAGNVKAKSTTTGFKADKALGAQIKSLHGHDPKKANIDRLKAIKAKVDAKRAQKEDLDMDEEKLLDMFEEFVEMFDDLGDLFEAHDMDLIEGFEATTEDLVEDELSEDFRTMSKTKQLIARRRAGRRKKLTVGYKLNKNKFMKK